MNLCQKCHAQLAEAWANCWGKHYCTKHGMYTVFEFNELMVFCEECSKLLNVCQYCGQVIKKYPN
jgi:hypothetical protein